MKKRTQTEFTWHTNKTTRWGLNYLSRQRWQNLKVSGQDWRLAAKLLVRLESEQPCSWYNGMGLNEGKEMGKVETGKVAERWGDWDTCLKTHPVWGHQMLNHDWSRWQKRRPTSTIIDCLLIREVDSAVFPWSNTLCPCVRGLGFHRAERGILTVKDSICRSVRLLSQSNNYLWRLVY